MPEMHVISNTKGKYDTYKGSTLSAFLDIFTQIQGGNMILIKD